MCNFELNNISQRFGSELAQTENLNQSFRAEFIWLSYTLCFSNKQLDSASALKVALKMPILWSQSCLISPPRPPPKGLSPNYRLMEVTIAD